MKLKKVEIRGFRSIEYMDIPFDGSGHTILVGKNESGKSNILKALNLLSDGIFENTDKKELYNQEAVVTFYFDLDNYEIDGCKEEFYKKFLVDPATELTKNLTIESFFEEYSEILYQVRCDEGNKWTSRRVRYDEGNRWTSPQVRYGGDNEWTSLQARYGGDNERTSRQVKYDKSNKWTSRKLPKELQISGNWYSVNQNIVAYGLDGEIPVGSYINDKFIEKRISAQEQEIVRDSLTPIKIEKIHEVLHKIVKEAAAPDNYIFPVIYWKYNAQEHDLPSYVEKQNFFEDLNSCIPLKNMFLLSGFEESDIHSKISRAHAQGPNQLKNLLDDVSEKTNEYIKKSWEECGNIKIKLRPDGEKIVVGIRDSKNTFDFQQRSDGFRRFISFLLLIGAKGYNSWANGPLILIDEPETGLHPSSAKSLKNELIDIGKNSVIVYATHSISMIDAEDIERNLTVYKEEENTKIKEEKEDGTSPAENIYQAIGYSIYEELKQKNILLEGYTDKKILKSCLTGENWNCFGICYTGGVTNIKHIIPILELGSRKYLILSDADYTAEKTKKEMENPEYWYTYKDLGSEAVTIEDFYNKDFFFNTVNDVLQKYNVEAMSHELLSDNGRMKSIKAFLGKNIGKKMEGENNMCKEITCEIKKQSVLEFKKEKLNLEKIEEVLNAFLQKVKQL